MSVHTQRVRRALSDEAEHCAPDVLFRVTRGLHVIRARTHPARTAHRDDETPSTKGRPLTVNPTTDLYADVIALEALAESWPVGRRVRHRHSMWLGTIVSNTPLGCPGVSLGMTPAHCLVPAEGGFAPGAVCVEWDHPDQQPGAADRAAYPRRWPDPIVGPAWMRPGVLRLLRGNAR